MAEEGEGSSSVVEAFHSACSKGDFATVQAHLLHLTPEIVEQLEYGLMLACSAGHLDIVVALLQLADPQVNASVDNETPLSLACEEGHLDVVHALLSLQGDRQVNIGAQYGHAFTCACSGGHGDILRVLAAHPDAKTTAQLTFSNFRACLSDPAGNSAAAFLDACCGELPPSIRPSDLKTAFRQACDHHSPDLALALLAHGLPLGLTLHTDAFALACKLGHLRVVQALLDLPPYDGVDANGIAFFESPLSNACEGGHPGVVDLLLGLTGDRRVDVHKGQHAALRMACRHGHPPIARRLLSLTGDRAFDAEGQGWRGLMDACGEGHTAVVQAFIDICLPAGTLPPRGVQAGMSAACGRDHAEVVQLLLTLPPDCGLVMNPTTGPSPFIEASLMDNPALRRVLLQHTGPHATYVNTQDSAALRQAVENGRSALVRELCALRGVNAPPPGVLRSVSGLLEVYGDVMWGGEGPDLPGRRAIILHRRERRMKARGCG